MQFIILTQLRANPNHTIDLPFKTQFSYILENNSQKHVNKSFNWCFYVVKWTLSSFSIAWHSFTLFHLVGEEKIVWFSEIIQKTFLYFRRSRFLLIPFILFLWKFYKYFITRTMFVQIKIFLMSELWFENCLYKIGILV